jgi:hypothetical protein
MATFQLFQCQLTNRQYNELNRVGWGGKPEFSAYADMSMGTMGGRTADAMVRAAAECGLFRHVADVRADDVTEVFEIGNMGPEENIIRHERMNSVSVGNVVVSTETGTAWFCDSIGWIELFEGTREAMLTTTESHGLVVA